MAKFLKLFVVTLLAGLVLAVACQAVESSFEDDSAGAGDSSSDVAAEDFNVEDLYDGVRGKRMMAAMSERPLKNYKIKFLRPDDPQLRRPANFKPRVSQML